MSENQPRGEGGEFSEKVTEQDILKVFDSTDDPFMTAGEVAEELPISRQGVHYRLERMREENLVGKKKTGAKSAGWWAKVAPRLDPAVAADLEADEGSAISHDDLAAELGAE
ncbi:winged helix-turn-helix domain-containing protein [Halorhabdus amylolytica]|uniref:winged helix-turn-helix domain-containing protein n=1 Tax=Halorhabdus amylolytica TaxID=2559573 RepID=UPI0010AB3BE1|nr:winged helix-turn-helix domain-containing protein [Halorhabdus amylolytica]